MMAVQEVPDAYAEPSPGPSEGRAADQSAGPVPRIAAARESRPLHRRARARDDRVCRGAARSRTSAGSTESALGLLASRARPNGRPEERGGRGDHYLSRVPARDGPTARAYPGVVCPLRPMRMCEGITRATMLPEVYGTLLSASQFRSRLA